MHRGGRDDPLGDTLQRRRRFRLEESLYVGDGRTGDRLERPLLSALAPSRIPLEGLRPDAVTDLPGLERRLEYPAKGVETIESGRLRQADHGRRVDARHLGEAAHREKRHLETGRA